MDIFVFLIGMFCSSNKSLSSKAVPAYINFGHKTCPKLCKIVEIKTYIQYNQVILTAD